jgi:hypothetical protein
VVDRRGIGIKGRLRLENEGAPVSPEERAADLVEQWQKDIRMGLPMNWVEMRAQIARLGHACAEAALKLKRRRCRK